MDKSYLILIAVILIGFFLIRGCINDRRMLELEEAKASLEKAKAEYEAIEKETGRADETGKLSTKLSEQCKQEISLYFKSITSIYSNYGVEVSSSQIDKDRDIILGLCSDVADELFNKGKNTNENLVNVYERLSKELSTKNKEVRDKLTALYSDNSEPQDSYESTSSSSSICECGYNKYNCADFSTYSEAKDCYDECGGISNDVHHLDGDLDGIPCESLRY